MTTFTVSSAYQFCQDMADRHYENFPVASRLLPGNIRNAVSAIYAFARTADDYADEGEYDAVTRIAKLDECDSYIDAIASGKPVDDPLYIALADSIAKYALPTSLFHDLISAFRQDVTKNRYRTFSEVLDYCRRSANPVGRLLLHLIGKADQENCSYSDNICSALQLINFFQDITQDYHENNRIYMPEEEMHSAGIGEEHIARQINDEAMANFMRFQYRRASSMLCAGMPLTDRLGTRMNLEIRATIHGGLRVIEKLENSENAFSRPRLGKKDFVIIMLRSMIHSKICQQYPDSIQYLKSDNR